MRRFDPVVLTLGAVGVSRYAASLAKPLEPIAATSQEFVDVGLVAGVPEEDVFGGFENPVERKRKLNYTEVGPEVAAGGFHGRDDEFPDFATELVELLIGESLEIGGCFNRRQNHCASLVLRSVKPPWSNRTVTTTTRAED